MFQEIYHFNMNNNYHSKENIYLNGNKIGRIVYNIFVTKAGKTVSLIVENNNGYFLAEIEKNYKDDKLSEVSSFSYNGDFTYFKSPQMFLYDMFSCTDGRYLKAYKAFEKLNTDLLNAVMEKIKEGESEYSELEILSNIKHIKNG